MMKGPDQVLQGLYIKVLQKLSWPLPPSVTLHTDLLDRKYTGLQIHCRFYKKNDKAVVFLKCLCWERNKKSVSFEQALSTSVGKDLTGNGIFLPT